VRAVVVAVVLAAAAVGLVSSAGAAPPAACRTSGLVVWLNTQGNGAAGSVFYQLELTNISGRTCTLRGYPGVSAISLAGRQIGAPASRNPARAVRTVTLRNGATAIANLQIAQAANYPRSLCRPTTAAGLRVYPPNETVAKTIPFPFAACARTSAHVLGVQAVAPA
jgi:hypothetical protein